MSTFTVHFSYPSSPPGLKLVGKRYVPANTRQDGLTLIFTHCTGAHKELWEPTIQKLFELHAKGSGLAIREAWAFDWQSHGEAGVVNAEALKSETNGLSVQEWADGLKAIAASEHLAGHHLVGLGHSSGAAVLLLSTLPPAPVSYRALVLVEPSLITRELRLKHKAERDAALVRMMKALDGRRDVWGSRAEARAYFAKRLPWKMWDARVLDLFVAHGLTEVPGGEGKVTLSCNKNQEKGAYAIIEPHGVAVDRLASLDASVPVHTIFGERIDLVPKYAHDSIVEVRKMVSITEVPGAGHQVVQEQPDRLAAAIAQVLERIAGARAKL
ncbi:alpha/beta-hydrolase [Obba rivulosa]|uniref:Alpha/beta-hydrolase n=1 Tax=Obba rivulosa TaxID=1052685 RepID=A0A8E2ANT5_9APHY|nr:alpha/beta-hydrolase [Obba rivulosa]